MPGPPKEPAFEAHNRLRAFTLDGMGDARKALSPLPRWNTKRNILVGGEGGEIFRGFFYQYFPSGHVPRAPEALTPTLFRWRFRRATGLPFRDPFLVKRMQERLTGSLATLAELGTSGYDTLDLFYLYERYSQWGASGERASWSRRWTPYEAKPAIFAAFLLPAPIGVRCTVSPRAVRRFLPLRAYWTPINGYGFLAFEGESRIRFRLRQAMGVQAKLVAKLDRRLSPRRATHDDARLQWIISDYTRQLLCNRNSLASSLFGSSGLNSLLEQQLRRRNHTATLAYLVNAEEFQRLVSEARSRVAR
jgi:hypothetical protein